MSLHTPLLGGNGYVRFAAPLLRSKARSAVCPATGAPPRPSVTFWQTHRVLLRSSASAPSTLVSPVVDARIHGSACAAPGTTRKIVPFAMLPKYTVPSRLDVRFSAWTPESAIVTSVRVCARTTADACVRDGQRIRVCLTHRRWLGD